MENQIEPNVEEPIDPDDEMKKMLGGNVSKLRRKLGISQLELGLSVGIGQKHVSKIEKGEIVIGWILLTKLADVLQISVDELVYTGHREQMTKLIKLSNQKKIVSLSSGTAQWTAPLFFIYKKARTAFLPYASIYYY